VSRRRDQMRRRRDEMRRAADSCTMLQLIAPQMIAPESTAT